MRTPTPPARQRAHSPESPASDRILIIGAGHFGSRAARILVPRSLAPLWIVDSDIERLRKLKAPRLERILWEGADFLVTHFRRLAPSTIIVPAIPLHLAFEWLKRFLDHDFLITRGSVPDGIEQQVPHSWTGQEGSTLISYADFRCPDDCPEPADHCTLTGKRREAPLYEILSRVELPGHRVHVLRSRQLAPGVGGYPVEDLWVLVNQVTRKPHATWLLGTACRCHGIVTAVHIRRRTQTESQCGPKEPS